MLPPARWKRGRATRCEPAGRALWCAGFHRWGSGLARWGTRDELVREEKRYRFSEARMEPSTFDTHNCERIQARGFATAKDLADIGPGFWSFRLRFRLAHQEPSKTVQLKRRTCQREVLGITRKRRATRRSRTGDLLITNSGQDETAQQYLGRLRHPDVPRLCRAASVSRQRASSERPR